MIPTITHQPAKLPRVVCDAHPEWVSLYDEAWRLAFANVVFPTNPAWLPHMACMPGVKLSWQWDSSFMTLFGRYSNGTIPCMNNVDNFYRLQRPDGFIAMAYSIETDQAVWPRINPPLYAWVEWEYFLLTGDDSRFGPLLPVLARYFDWIKTNRRRSNHLYWFEDSGSAGMDNAPRGGYSARDLAGSDLCHVDLACQQALSAFHLSKIAARVGESGLAAHFEEERLALSRLINERHWCERFGFYFDLFTRTDKADRNNFLNHKTVAGFWPILSRVANESQMDRLAVHLRDPDAFATLHPVPSLSRDDPNYDPMGGYWLGGVWAPTNFMIVKGLQLRGCRALAREIAVQHLNAMVAVWRDPKRGGIWEAYAPEALRPATCKNNDLVRADFVGWSGLGPIAMLIEQVLGFHFDAAQNRIAWNIATPGRHGIENLQFNGRTVSLIYDVAVSAISVRTSGEIVLEVTHSAKRQEVRTLAPGKHQIKLVNQ